MRRILIVLTVATAVVSASAVVVGPWRLEPFGVRLLSVANPIKPLTFSLVLALLLALTSPLCGARISRVQSSGFTRSRDSSCGCSASGPRRR